VSGRSESTVGRTDWRTLAKADFATCILSEVDLYSGLEHLRRRESSLDR
jgi:hypothetical protein